MVDASGVIDMLEGAGTTAAKAALVGVIGIAFDLNYVAILDISDDAAVSMAEIAKRLYYLNTRGIDIHLGVHARLFHNTLKKPLLFTFSHLPFLFFSLLSFFPITFTCLRNEKIPQAKHGVRSLRWAYVAKGQARAVPGNFMQAPAASSLHAFA